MTERSELRSIKIGPGCAFMRPGADQVIVLYSEVTVSPVPFYFSHVRRLFDGISEYDQIFLHTILLTTPV